MASEQAISIAARRTFHLQLDELKQMKTDLDQLKTELNNAESKYEQRLTEYEAKLQLVDEQIEAVRQEDRDKETNLVNATSEWLDVKSKLEQSALSSKQKVILNVGGEYFETTVETLTKVTDSAKAYFKALFSRQWQLEKDPKDESIFIDRDGHLFGFILQYFRTGHLNIDAGDTLLRRDLIAEAKFYQIDHLVTLLQTTTSSVRSETKTLFPNTKLLAPPEQHQLNVWFGKPQQQWQLIYQASRDGYTGKSFHQHCDGRAPTVTVIRSHNGCVFGGFTTIPWSSEHVDKADSSAFLFTLRNPHRIPPTAYCVRPKPNSFAVAHKPENGPTFGSAANGGSDIFLHSPFNAVGCRIFFPRTYVDTTGIGRVTFTGDANFLCEDVEVFTLAK